MSKTIPVPMLRPIDDIADDLQKLFVSEFGGKKRGRLFISRENMYTVTGRRANLQTVTEVRIMKALYKRHALVLVIVGREGYGVIEEGKVSGWRPAPKKLLT